MKSVLIAISILLFPFLLRAQNFGDTEVQIKNGMSKQTYYKFLDKKEVKGNLTQLTYVAQGSSKSFFLDQSKKCVKITALYPLKDLPEVIKINNELANIAKTGDLEWYNTKTNVRMSIEVFNDDQVFQETLTEDLNQ